MQIQRLIVGVLFVSLAASTGVTEAPSTPHIAIDPPAIAVEALRAGVQGNWDEREAGLERALELSPDEKLARWHKGYLRYGKAWVHYDKIDDLLPIRQILTVYEAQREHAEDDVASHLELANWCRQHRLPKQERAHLSRALQLNSNHRIARKRLGYRLVNGQWVSNSELWQAASQSRETRRAFRKWQPELKKLLTALDSRNEAQWLDAKEKLLAIVETEAIPAIEVVLLSTASRHASLALAAINNIPQRRSARRRAVPC